jgi:hypothetical protein
MIRNRSRLRAVALAGFAGLALAAIPASPFAATPASGTVSVTTKVAWDFAATYSHTYFTGTIGQLIAQCPPGYCDNFDLTVKLPQPAAGLYATQTATLSLNYTWTSSTPTDMDLFVISPDNTMTGPGTPDDATPGAGIEKINLVNPKEGVYHVRSIASLTAAPQAAHGTASLTVGPRLIPSPITIPYQEGDPFMTAYGPPPGIGKSAVEPSIGSDWKTGAVMYLADTEAIRVTFDDGNKPPKATWKDATHDPVSGTTSFDPILYTDSRTGRTIVSQLISDAVSPVAPVGAGCSLSAFTDDDGATWTPDQGCSTIAGYDHQALGGGNFTAGAAPHPTYPNAVVYCSQNGYYAQCGVSQDGGQTYGPGVPIYTLQSCNGLHGHPGVAPDGTIYIPNRDCGGMKGVAVSSDEGLNWAVHTLPTTTPRIGSDPSVSVGSRGTVYFGFQDGDGHPKIAISEDKGLSWSEPKDVGRPFNIQNTQFAEVIAGDDDRAAFAFLGTPQAGDDQAADFPGEWHLYVAFTYDRARTWKTIDVTPNDPVQRGCIWSQGGSNVCRNLYDFNGITVDKQGRVIVGYAKGCTGGCVTNPDYKKATHNQLAQIARLNCGKGLFATYDPGFAAACPTAVASVTATTPTPSVPPTTVVTTPLPATSTVPAGSHGVVFAAAMLALAVTLLWLPWERLRRR